MSEAVSNDQARKNLRKWMKENEYTLRSLAEPLGITHSFISHMLSGRRPITDAFRWRFGTKFGYRISRELLGPTAEPIEYHDEVTTL